MTLSLNREWDGVPRCLQCGDRHQPMSECPAVPRLTSAYGDNYPCGFHLMSEAEHEYWEAEAEKRGLT